MIKRIIKAYFPPSDTLPTSSSLSDKKDDKKKRSDEGNKKEAVVEQEEEVMDLLSRLAGENSQHEGQLTGYARRDLLNILIIALSLSSLLRLDAT